MVAKAPESVAHAVQARLNREEPFGGFVRVDVPRVREGDESRTWWYVPVMYEEDPYNVHKYYVMFAKVEDALRDQDKLDVLLVPIIKEHLTNS